MSPRKPADTSHEFAVPTESLPSSGERCTPTVGDQIQHEHFHRYLLAVRFCEGKNVLDVACGEGYGTALLGTVARTVVGVDSSPEAIAHAGKHYGSKTVAFELAEATALPLDDSSVDTVVCFETLEHLTDHDGLLSELRRVLRPDGVVLLSTPDRDTYLAGEAPNPYHLREVNGPELLELLRRHFENVALGGQSAGSSSTIVANDERSRREPLVFFDRLEGNRFVAAGEPGHPVYLIAVASDGELPPLGSSVLIDSHHLPDVHAAYRGELTRVWGEVTERDERVQLLESTVAAARAEVARLRAEAETTRTDVELLERTIGTAEAQIEKLRQERDLVRRELEAAYGSASWRITGPIRVAKRAARAVVARARRVVRLRTRLRALRERVDGRDAAVPDEAARPPLLPLAGEEALPPELRDERIAHSAELWARRMSEVRSAALLTYRPLVSVLLPTYETPVDVLDLAVGSVLAQTYEHWELVVVDDGSTSERLQEYLAELPSRDPRISVTAQRDNAGVSAATNVALERAEGEFVAMLDHDDELHPDALLEIVRALNADPTLDAVYTDQEYVERDGTPADLLLKPDWSPRLFWGVMYVGHLLVVRRSAALSLGGFDPAFDNVQDFEFMLRLSEQTSRIAHVPKVLYRWRRIPGSVAFHGDEKSQIDELQAAAVTAHFNRTGVAAVAQPHARHAHRATIVPRRRESASVTVVLDSRDVRAREQTRDALAAMGDPRLDVVVARADERLDSVVTNVRGDYVLSMDSGLVIDADDWLDHLLLYADLPDVAAVAP